MTVICLKSFLSIKYYIDVVTTSRLFFHSFPFRGFTNFSFTNFDGKKWISEQLILKLFIEISYFFLNIMITINIIYFSWEIIIRSSYFNFCFYFILFSIFYIERFFHPKNNYSLLHFYLFFNFYNFYFYFLL